MSLSERPVIEPYEIEEDCAYIGQWKNGRRFGRGKGIWKDGSIFEGYWVNGKASGFGQLIHSDGDIYIGEWKNNMAHGNGRYTTGVGTSKVKTITLGSTAKAMGRTTKEISRRIRLMGRVLISG